MHLYKATAALQAAVGGAPLTAALAALLELTLLLTHGQVTRNFVNWARTCFGAAWGSAGFDSMPAAAAAAIVSAEHRGCASPT